MWWLLGSFECCDVEVEKVVPAKTRCDVIGWHDCTVSMPWSRNEQWRHSNKRL
jgi:hypothetical protein